ncbi:MAG: IS1595 family transposase [Bacteroidales bacterium]|jgi:transposase-like protein|nr:IS1595 family transposase [Bacteroidales bacterium]
MQTQNIVKFIESINNLDTKSYSLLKEAIEKRDSIKFVSYLLNNDEIGSNKCCPYCDSRSYNRWGIRSDLQRYKCKECGKTFNTLTGTPLAHLHKKGRWLSYAQCLIEGLSIRKAAAECGVHKNTSFRWRHRFLQNTNKIKPQKLTGVAEVNELIFAWSDKGNKRLKRKSRKRGYKSATQIPFKSRVFTLFCRDRGKNTFDEIYYKFSAYNIKKDLSSLFAKDILFCSQNKAVYMKYTKENCIRHGILSIPKNEKIRKNVVHIQNVLEYQFNLQEWMLRFRGVATKYLHNYLSWYREMDEFDHKITPETILIRAKRPERYNTNHFR